MVGLVVKGGAGSFGKSLYFLAKQIRSSPGLGFAGLDQGLHDFGTALDVFRYVIWFLYSNASFI